MLLIVYIGIRKCLLNITTSHLAASNYYNVLMNRSQMNWRVEYNLISRFFFRRIIIVLIINYLKTVRTLCFCTLTFFTIFSGNDHHNSISWHSGRCYNVKTIDVKKFAIPDEVAGHWFFFIYKNGITFYLTIWDIKTKAHFDTQIFFFYLVEIETLNCYELSCSYEIAKRRIIKSVECRKMEVVFLILNLHIKIC